MERTHFVAKERRLDWRQLHVMGILNVTPDSFSDGGLFYHKQKALDHALNMVRAGATIIDIGGESTRPGAAAVLLEQELERVVPVIEALRARSDVMISIDTQKTAVMQAAAEAGADMVNDVNALQDEGAVAFCAQSKMGVCLMHKQGVPQTMQAHPQYQDATTEVLHFLEDRVATCLRAGIAADAVMIDPGFGFGKTPKHNMELMHNIALFTQTPWPVLLGVSRKKTLGMIVGQTEPTRLQTASVAMASYAYTQGVKVMRVHDVAQTVEAAKIIEAVLNKGAQFK